MNPSLNHILADKSRIELILDFLPYPFLISELQHGTMANVYVNKRFLEEIGYTLNEIPTIDAWFESAYPEPLYRGAIISSWNDLVNEALRKGKESALMRVLVRTKYNEDKWYEVKSTVTDSLQFVAFVDITEVMMKERELQRLNDNKNQTLSILAHDVRSPLTSLNTITRLMLDGNFEPSEFLDKLTAINEKSAQVLEFIDTTLLWTRANFNSISFRIEEVDVQNALTKILQVYSNIYQTKNLTITKKLNGTIIRTDQEILTIILRNLLSNAIKFSRDKGEIVISFQHGIDNFSLCIKDNGVGMSPETLNKLQQDHHTSTLGTRDEKGLGLGLKLCRQLIKKLNGEIVFQSKPGSGTEVTVTLPCSKS
jgi:signal transduction histidine kinase